MVRVVKLRRGLSAQSDAQAPAWAWREQVHLVWFDFEWRGLSAFADGATRKVKRAIFIIAVAAVVLGLGIVGLRCGGSSGSPAVERVKGEIEAGRKERRNLQADELAALARDMRLMAQRYLKQGDKQKAQRAIGAAQELDKKIQSLRDVQ